LLNCTPGEIIFTSGGTEADNAIIRGAIQTYNIKHVISSQIEHHAVEHTLATLEMQGEIKLHYVRFDEKGHIDLVHLESLLKEFPNALVALMHANNEIGNLIDIQKVGDLCQQYGAYLQCKPWGTTGMI